IEWSVVDDRVIKQIGLGFFKPIVTAGDLNEVLGTPQSIAFLNGSAGSFRAAGYVWLYPETLVYFRAPDYQSVNIDTLSSGMTFYQDAQTLQQEGYICAYPKTWGGFGVNFDRTVYYMCR